MRTTADVGPTSGAACVDELTAPAVAASSRRDVTWDVISERINEVITVSDLSGAMIYASPAVRHFGWQPWELIGLTGADLAHPDDLYRFAANTAHVLSTGQSDGHADREYRFRRRDGGWVWLEADASLLPGADDRPVGILTVFRDVSERRAARDALHEQARRARLAEEVTGLGYWRMDARTLECTWSEQIFRMHGLKRGDTIALQAAMEQVHPDDTAASEARIARALATGEGWGESLTRIVQPDGAVRYLSGRGICETDADGRVVAVFGTVLDVTEQETMKAQLRAALAQAERAATVKSEFLANMSHEIRTPLTAVLGFAGLLAEREDLDGLAQAQVARIAGASRALLAVVNDVLDFSKLEAGEVTIRRRPSDPERAAREVLEIFDLQAREKGLELVFTPDLTLPPALLLDEDRLRQILINLVGNAVKFTADGFVSLALNYDARKGVLVAEVTDTGPGIASADAEKLFQRFSQVDGSSTRSKGGTGLGLAICRGLAEAMDGAMEAESVVGRGSTFRLILPAIRAIAPDTGKATSKDLSLLAGLRVLVADDNPVNRELARAILAAAGVEITEACDGADAVDVAMALPFDVILMDLRMPRLDGRAALAALRAQPGPNRDIPVLAFSADGLLDAGQARAAGFQGQVRKPTTPAELLGAVARAADFSAQDEQGGAYVAAS